jgi:hypothetical protein
MKNPLITLMMLFLYTCTVDEELFPDPAGDADLKALLRAVQ